MTFFKPDSKVSLYLAAVVAGFFLIWLSDEISNAFFQDLFFYVGAIALALFSFVIIFFALFSFFHKH